MAKIIVVYYIWAALQDGGSNEKEKYCYHKLFARYVPWACDWDSDRGKVCYRGTAGVFSGGRSDRCTFTDRSGIISVYGSIATADPIQSIDADTGIDAAPTNGGSVSDTGIVADPNGKPASDTNPISDKNAGSAAAGDGYAGPGADKRTYFDTSFVCGAD